MDYWYDDSSEGSDGRSRDDEADIDERYRLQVEARAKGRRQQLAARGEQWIAQTSSVVHRCKQDLQRSPFWESVKAALRANSCGDDVTSSPVELVCYGLGELDSPSGSYQLALLLLLSDELRIHAGKVFAFDPVHTTQEEAVLQRCGCTPLRCNEHAMRVCQVPTCFYMPHCPFTLYNNLIWANWAAPWQLTLIGNDLTFHALHNHPFATVAPHLCHAMRTAGAVRLPDTFTPAESLATLRSTDGSWEVSSSQIFGLSTLYTFPTRQQWERASENDVLATWLREGRPELPSTTNFVRRLESELKQIQERATWLEDRIAQEKMVARL